MPPWVQHTKKPVNDQYREIPLSAEEVVDLASAFQFYGFWRIELDTGLFFATEDVCRIFGMQPKEGPLDLVAITSRIHPDDMPVLMQIYERASHQRLTYHSIYRVKADAEDYKYVRTVGKFRDKPGTSGEVVGITYEFFAQSPVVTFFIDDKES